MPYTLLIVEDPHQRTTRTEAEGHAVYDRMVQFSQRLKTQGLLLATQSLTSHAAATRVTVRAGKPQVLDGPFAEAKEMVGGSFCWTAKPRQKLSPLPPNARPQSGVRWRCAKSAPVSPDLRRRF